MTQEDKFLLLQDLCARLPYGVFINFEKTHNIFPLTSIKMEEMFPLNDFQVLLNDKYPIQWCKPYLRPKSSMTKEERMEYFLLKHRDNDREDNIILIDEAFSLIDWLLSHHFDYRGLIEKELALVAPEGMYNINEK